MISREIESASSIQIYLLRQLLSGGVENEAERSTVITDVLKLAQFIQGAVRGTTATADKGTATDISEGSTAESIASKTTVVQQHAPFERLIDKLLEECDTVTQQAPAQEVRVKEVSRDIAMDHQVSFDLSAPPSPILREKKSRRSYDDVAPNDSIAFDAEENAQMFSFVRSIEDWSALKAIIRDGAREKGDAIGDAFQNDDGVDVDDDDCADELPPPPPPPLATAAADGDEDQDDSNDGHDAHAPSTSHADVTCTRSPQVSKLWLINRIGQRPQVGTSVGVRPSPNKFGLRQVCSDGCAYVLCGARVCDVLR